jgi:hypothetical protein
VQATFSLIDKASGRKSEVERYPLVFGTDDRMERLIAA